MDTLKFSKNTEIIRHQLKMCLDQLWHTPCTLQFKKRKTRTLKYIFGMHKSLDFIGDRLSEVFDLAAENIILLTRSSDYAVEDNKTQNEQSGKRCIESFRVILQDTRDAKGFLKEACLELASIEQDVPTMKNSEVAAYLSPLSLYYEDCVGEAQMKMYFALQRINRI